MFYKATKHAALSESLTLIYFLIFFLLSVFWLAPIGIWRAIMFLLSWRGSASLCPTPPPLTQTRTNRKTPTTCRFLKVCDAAAHTDKQTRFIFSNKTYRLIIFTIFPSNCLLKHRNDSHFLSVALVLCSLWQNQPYSRISLVSLLWMTLKKSPVKRPWR